MRRRRRTAQISLSQAQRSHGALVGLLALSGHGKRDEQSIELLHKFRIFFLRRRVHQADAASMARTCAVLRSAATPSSLLEDEVEASSEVVASEVSSGLALMDFFFLSRDELPATFFSFARDESRGGSWFSLS